VRSLILRLNAHLFATAAAVLITGLGATATAADRPPNLVFIMADDLGYNELASYGQRVYPTPHTDRLAREGMRFTDAHSPNAVCSPTRYAVVTGTDPYRRYATSHVLFNGEALVIRDGEATVASLLRRKGYRTGVVGKWHLGLGDALPRDLNQPGRGPNDLGFDESFIVADGPDMKPAYYLKNGRIVDVEKPAFAAKPGLIKRVDYQLIRQAAIGSWEDRRPGNAMGARFADEAVAFIERHRELPFFLYFPTCSIHVPFTVDPRFAGKSGIGPRGDYVMEFDWAVGRVMETLDRLGLAGNTLLIVTSDNGGQVNAGREPDADPHPNYPWRGGKGDPWEGGHRIPFLIRWPGKVADGSVNHETLSLVDLTATACALAGVALPPDAAFDSHNLLPSFLGQTHGHPVRAVTVMGTRGIEHLILREGPWKLIFPTSGARPQLYQLDEDPAETTDLATANPEKTAALRAALMHDVESGASRPGAQGRPGSLDALLQERDHRNRMLEARFGTRR
jgi:arylsulfatase A